jgi:uncharacterized repeat protein (TIGR02543 family)
MAQKRTFVPFGWAVQTLLLLFVCNAHAQEPDFDIYKDGIKLTGTLPTKVHYGQPYTFSVQMEDGSEDTYNWCWYKEGEEISTICNAGLSYTLRVSDNVNDYLTIIVKATKGSYSKQKSFTLETVSTCTVSFNSNGGGQYLPQTVPEYDKINKPIDPAKPGYEFEYWYQGTNSSLRFDFNEEIINDITLTAKWKLIEYIITYVPNNGETPQEQHYTIESPALSMFTKEDNCSYKFEGWFYDESFSGWPITNFTPNASNLGNKTFYAKWTAIEQRTPSADLLVYSTPEPNIYNGNEYSFSAEQRTNECEIGKHTILYSKSSETPSPEAPKEAGEYNIFVSFEGSQYYKAALIDLQETLIIEPYKLTGSYRLDCSIENKTYDGTEKATVVYPIFLDDIPNFCVPKIDEDYFITAEFTSPKAGVDVEVNAKFDWKQNPPILKNCDTSGFKVVFSETKYATIFKANVSFDIIVPEIYRLSSPESFKPRVITNSFVEERGIIWEYKKESESEYSLEPPVLGPDVFGSWNIRATLEETNDYFGTFVVKTFNVTSGSSEPVAHEIKFKEPEFEKDLEFSIEDKATYFVYSTADPEKCEIENAVVQIEVAEQEIYLKLNDIRPRSCDENKSVLPCEEECRENECYMRYHIPITFGKPGLDTLVYNLYSKDGIFSKQYVLLIETPVPFDRIVKQKWNNTLFVNNNYVTNGGYSFTDFKWFKNDIEVSNLQFYSAGPRNSDELKTSDKYNIQMNYSKNGETLRISTCDGYPKTIEAPVTSEAAFKKRVLGIGSKTVGAGAKIYNSKGCVANGNAPGVYLVEEK